MDTIESQSEHFFSEVGEYRLHAVVRKLRADAVASESDDTQSEGKGSRSAPARQMRILLVTHPQCIPPESASGPSTEGVPWQAEQDVVWGLRCLGHDVRVVGVIDDLIPIDDSIRDFRPHVVFNMLEEFDGIAQYDQNVVSYLECRGVRYTGAGPKGLLLARDKALAKTIVEAAGVRTPEFFKVQRGRTLTRLPEAYPVIVKSTTEDASLGIAEASVVSDEKALRARVEYIHEEIGTDALIERYVEGIDVYVALTGNLRPEIYPARAMRFPKGGPRIATRQAKWNEAYRKKHRILSGPLGEVSKTLEKEMLRFSRAAYEALALNGYARLDFRLGEDGKLYFLEANPNPHLGRKEDFATSAQHAGLSYPALLSKILSLGLKWRSAFA